MRSVFNKCKIETVEQNKINNKSNWYVLKYFNFDNKSF